MNQPINVLCALVRLLRPSGGVHADPSGYLRAVFAEVFRRRSTRVRRYARSLPSVAEAGPVPRPRRPVDVSPVVLVPSRVPTDYVPVVQPEAVDEPAAMVRGHYRAWERSRVAAHEVCAA